MSSVELTIGSRGSDLALYQANFIRDILAGEHGCKVEIKIIKTSGDRFDNLSFDKMEGKGFFTKELEDALLDRSIDLAIHSLKDVMTTQPKGLKLGAVGYRVDSRELLLVRKEAFTGIGVIPVKENGSIGTSSNRRKCQIVFHNSSLKICDLRGNVPTRIEKLRKGEYDAIIIAAAGVIRLKLDVTDFESILLDPQQFLPAPGQGILGIQIRDNNSEVEDVVSKLGSRQSIIESELERGLLSRFDQGCSLPLGVFSKSNGNDHMLKAVLGTQNGNEWGKLRETEVKGTVTKELVDQAYAELTRD